MPPRLRIERQLAVSVLEAAQAEHGSLEAWVAEVLRALGQAVPSEIGVGGGLLLRDRAGYAVQCASFPSWPMDPRPMLQRVAAQSTAQLDPFYLEAGAVSTMQRIGRTLPKELDSYHDEFCRLMGAADVIGLQARSGEGHVLTFGSPQVRPFTISPADRQLLTRIMLHVESGLRLRLVPDSVRAVLRPDGTLQHATGPLRERAAQERVAHHARTMERSRLREARELPESIDGWTALVSGRYGFVERVDSDGQRYYLVLENPPHNWASSRLSPRDAQVLELSARGLSGKMVAYSLGLSARAVSERLASAAASVGLASRIELVRLGAMLLGPDVTRAIDELQLTEAEAEVLACLRRGLSNADIARDRGRSIRTVANQVASLLRKSGASSRRALVTMASRRESGDQVAPRS